MLRALQKQRLTKMLRPEDPPFKILVLDERTQEVMSPLIKVSDLRDAGVTSHLLISNGRSQIKDVPAIYFLSSASGLDIDLSRDLYAAYYLNSLTSFKRSDLEHAAAIVSEREISQKVKVVYDQFLDFISLQDDFFTLGIAGSFAERNSPDVMRRAVLGLFSVFVTLGEMPFIVAGACDVGRMLEQKMRSMKILKNGIKKPLLIVLSRDFDIGTPTKHVMGYVELIHDLFRIKLNKVEGITIDTDSEFYRENSMVDFPVVAEIVDKELHSYRKELALRSLSERSDKAEIQAVLESAPHLQKKSEVVNSNINLCIKVLEEIKRRKLDDFYRMEESFDQDEIMELSQHGTENDILRLCAQMVGTKNSDLVDPILKKRGIGTEVIGYIREHARDDQGFGSMMKSLLFKKNIPLYTYVENVLGQIKSQRLDGLECYDPGHTGIFYNEISRVVVYIHGGATYLELKALKDLEKIYKIPVVLGGSEILNADCFLDQVRREISPH